MKKKHLMTATAAALCLALMSTSCVGSFSLTNRVLGWNRQVGNKFVNELVFFAFWLLPVYEVCALADVLVLNSIEFWSGSNPMACGTRVIDGRDGRYLVECDGRGYTVTSENDGSVVRLDFDADLQTWSVDYDGQSYPLMTIVDDSHVLLPAADGSMTLVETSADGVWAYRAMAEASLSAQR